MRVTVLRYMPGNKGSWVEEEISIENLMAIKFYEGDEPEITVSESEHEILIHSRDDLLVSPAPHNGLLVRAGRNG